MNSFCKKIVRTLERLYAFSFVSVCITLMVAISYWYFIQDDNIISNINYETIIEGGDHTVKAGSVITLKREYCLNTREYLGKVNRQFTNHIIYQLPDITTVNTQTKKGCEPRFVQVEIPPSLPSDNYKYDVNITYVINPIKTVVYRMPTVELKVVNPATEVIKDLLKKEQNK